MRENPQHGLACFRRGTAVLALLLAASPAMLMAGPAWGLSEIQREDLPPAKPDAGDDRDTVPFPGPTQMPPAVDPHEGEPEPDEPEQVQPDDSEPTTTGRPDLDPDAPLPEVIYDLERLPAPAKRMRELIVEACRSGDVEALRPLLGTGESMTQLSLGGVESDPIEFIRELSGDQTAQEILAILLEVLEAGFVHLDEGTDSELYVWPYFFAVPLEKLDARQRVELFTIVTAGDYEDMKSYGAYIFYRVGITPEGRWAFFVAGD